MPACSRGVPLTLLPYESAREVQITGTDLERLAAIGGTAGWIGSRARGWLNYWEHDIGRTGFYPFDLMAAGYVVRPDLFACAPVSAWGGADAGVFGWFGRRGLFVRPREHPVSKPEAVAPAQFCPDPVENAGPWFLTRLTIAPETLRGR